MGSPGKSDKLDPDRLFGGQHLSREELEKLEEQYGLGSDQFWLDPNRTSHCAQTLTEDAEKARSWLRGSLETDIEFTGRYRLLSRLNQLAKETGLTKGDTHSNQARNGFDNLTYHSDDPNVIGHGDLDNRFHPDSLPRKGRSQRRQREAPSTMGYVPDPYDPFAPRGDAIRTSSNGNIRSKISKPVHQGKNLSPPRNAGSPVQIRRNKMMPSHVSKDTNRMRSSRSPKAENRGQAPRLRSTYSKEQLNVIKGPVPTMGMSSTRNSLTSSQSSHAFPKSPKKNDGTVRHSFDTNQKSANPLSGSYSLSDRKENTLRNSSGLTNMTPLSSLTADNILQIYEAQATSLINNGSNSQLHNVNSSQESLSHSNRKPWSSSAHNLPKSGDLIPPPVQNTGSPVQARRLIRAPGSGSLKLRDSHSPRGSAVNPSRPSVIGYFPGSVSKSIEKQDAADNKDPVRRSLDSNGTFLTKSVDRVGNQLRQSGGFSSNTPLGSLTVDNIMQLYESQASNLIKHGSSGHLNVASSYDSLNSGEALRVSYDRMMLRKSPNTSTNALNSSKDYQDMRLGGFQSSQPNTLNTNDSNAGVLNSEVNLEQDDKSGARITSQHSFELLEQSVLTPSSPNDGKTDTTGRMNSQHSFEALEEHVNSIATPNSPTAVNDTNTISRPRLDSQGSFELLEKDVSKPKPTFATDSVKVPSNYPARQTEGTDHQSAMLNSALRASNNKFFPDQSAEIPISSKTDDAQSIQAVTGTSTRKVEESNPGGTLQDLSNEKAIAPDDNALGRDKTDPSTRYTGSGSLVTPKEVEMPQPRSGIVNPSTRATSALQPKTVVNQLVRARTSGLRPPGSFLPTPRAIIRPQNTSAGLNTAGRPPQSGRLPAPSGQPTYARQQIGGRPVTGRRANMANRPGTSRSPVNTARAAEAHSRITQKSSSPSSRTKRSTEAISKTGYRPK